MMAFPAAAEKCAVVDINGTDAPDMT